MLRAVEGSHELKAPTSRGHQCGASDVGELSRASRPRLLRTNTMPRCRSSVFGSLHTPFEQLVREIGKSRD